MLVPDKDSVPKMRAQAFGEQIVQINPREGAAKKRKHLICQKLDLPLKKTVVNKLKFNLESDAVSSYGARG